MPLNSITTHKNEDIHQGKNPTFESTSTDDSTSLINAPLKSAGGLAVAKTTRMRKLYVDNKNGDDWFEHMRGNFIGGGAYASKARALIRVEKTNLGNKLIIPFVAQSSENVISYVTIKAMNGRFNQLNSMPLRVDFAVGSISFLSNFTVLNSGGNYSDARVDEMNVEIDLSTSYDFMILDIEVFRTNLKWSIKLADIRLN